jgi:dTDP-4-dehydrorhamnose reductase
MKILIAGASGQLGKKLAEALSREHKLVLTDSATMDITDPQIVRDIVAQNRPDYIINAAAYTRVDQAEGDIETCRQVNAQGAKNIAAAAREFGAKLIYISTDFVFDGVQKTPYQETDAANPLSVYGLTKYEGEKFIQEIGGEYYIVRVSWLFGELPQGYKGTNFVEVMLKLAREREEIKVVNDQIGSPTYTGDLALAIGQIIAQNPPSGIYHFSGTGECSWYDFAREIFSQTNTKIRLTPIASAQYPQKAQRPPYSYLDKAKIENALGIKVRPWPEMLKDYLNKR